MSFIKRLFEDSKKAEPKSGNPSNDGSGVSAYLWTYFENKSFGIRLPHPKGWIANEQSGKIIIHDANSRLIGGGILELGMTLVCMDTSNSPLAGSNDLVICKRCMEVMLTQAGGTLDWSEEGEIPRDNRLSGLVTGFKKLVLT
jgi:hypothetical protein